MFYKPYDQARLWHHLFFLRKYSPFFKRVFYAFGIDIPKIGKKYHKLTYTVLENTENRKISTEKLKVFPIKNLVASLHLSKIQN